MSAPREVSLAALAQCNAALIFWFFCIKTKEQRIRFGAINTIHFPIPREAKLAALTQCNAALIFWFFCIKTKEQRTKFGAINLKINHHTKKAMQSPTSLLINLFKTLLHIHHHRHHQHQ